MHVLPGMRADFGVFATSAVVSVTLLTSSSCSYPISNAVLTITTSRF